MAVLIWKIFPCRDVLKLKKTERRIDIPVFHDDQHGTAIVTMAGLLNALKLTNRNLRDIKVVAAVQVQPVSRSLKCCYRMVSGTLLCDTKGAVYEGRPAE